MGLTIQEFANETGLSTHTLRYYERIGLIAPIERREGGQRLYRETDRTWVVLLRCLRATGMPIARMIQFAELCRQNEHNIPDRVQLLEAHEREVREQIAQLQESLVVVRQKLEAYHSLLAKKN